MSMDRDKITERRLRSIFDALDSGQSKRAVAESDKVLKKHADIHAARALKALALIRLQRDEEAAQILDNMPSAVCVHTLQALTHCYKELNQSSFIVGLYDRATAAMPGNDDHLAQLFMAHVRMLNYKKQQQIASQLVKSTVDNRSYHLWSIMSLVMQGVDDPPNSKLAKHMYYPLALKMMEKIAAVAGEEERNQTILHLLVLHKSAQYRQLINLIDSVTTIDIRGIFGYHPLTIHAALNERDYCIVECGAALKRNPDDCAIYDLMIECALTKLEGDEETHARNDVVTLVTDIILSLIADADEDSHEIQPSGRRRQYRGAHLARMQWIDRLLQKDIVPSAELGTFRLGEPLRLLADYFDAFGDRPCCFDDMRAHLDCIGETQQDEFARVVEGMCGLAGGEGEEEDKEIVYAKDVAQLYRHCTCISICRRLGVHSAYGVGRKMRFVRTLLRRYENAYGRFLVQPQSLSMQAADSYLLLAVELIWDVYCELVDLSLITDLVVLLEHAYTRSPANKCLLFILGRSYALLAAGDGVIDVGVRLRVKAIQYDSIGYVTMDRLTDCGMYAQSAEMCAAFAANYAECMTQLNDQLVKAYHRLNFAHIIDMSKMHKKLTNSMYRVCTFTVHHYFHVLTKCQTFDSLLSHLLRGEQASTSRLMTHPNCDDIGLTLHDDGIDWTTLSDNRDLTVLPLATPIDAEVADRITSPVDRMADETKMELIDAMKLTHLTIRCVTELCRRGGDGVDRLRRVTFDFKSHYRHCATLYKSPNVRSLDAPAPTNLHDIVVGPYFTLIDALFDMAYLLVDRPTASTADVQRRNVYDSRLMSDSSLSSAISSASSALSSMSTAEHSVKSAESGISTATTLNGKAVDENRADVLPTVDRIQSLCKAVTTFPPITMAQFGRQIRIVALAQQTVGVALLLALIVKKLMATAKRGKAVVVAAPSGAALLESVECRMGDILSVIGQMPAAVHKVVHDMHNIIVERKDFDPLKETYGLCDDETLPTALVDALRMRRPVVAQSVRESYYHSLLELRTMNEHQNKIVNSLKMKSTL